MRKRLLAGLACLLVLAAGATIAVAASSTSTCSAPCKIVISEQRTNGAGVTTNDAQTINVPATTKTVTSTQTVTTTPTTSSTTSTSTTSTSSSTTTSTTTPAGFTLQTQPIDGGTTYFATRWPGAAWADQHVLIGAWLEQPQNPTEIGYDAAAGENVYWNLAGTPGSNVNLVADYNVIRAGGMHIFAPSTDAQSGSETIGYDGWDESDGLGDGRGTFQADTGCATSNCGLTAAQFYYDGTNTNVTPAGATPPYPIGPLPIHQGFTKPVLFWDADANVFASYTDVESADTYWMTDNDLRQPSQGGCNLRPTDPVACGGGNGTGLTNAQSKLPANYEWNVTALEQLSGGHKPVIADVETGCPFNSGNNIGLCTTPPAMVAGAWHSLIAGARGILWFQHNFSGPCFSLRSIIDGSNPSNGNYSCQQTPGVTLHNMVQAMTAFDGEVAALNSVLLAPTVTNLATSTSDVSLLTKDAGQGMCWIFAGAGKPGMPPGANLSATFTLADGYAGPVTVYGENRTVQATGGSFSDTFADANAVHVYQLADPACA